MFKNIKLKKALIGAGLGVLGVGTIVGTTWSINHFISQKQNVDTGFDADNENHDYGETVDLPKNIVFKRNVAGQAATLNVRATVLPDTVVNKKLTWELVWTDGGSHGNIADYVTVAPSVDTLSAVITLKAGFNNQIKLVVKSQQDNSKQANCTLDYQKRIVGVDEDLIYTAYNGNEMSYEELGHEQRIKSICNPSTVTKVTLEDVWSDQDACRQDFRLLSYNKDSFDVVGTTGEPSLDVYVKFDFDEAYINAMKKIGSFSLDHLSSWVSGQDQSFSNGAGLGYFDNSFISLYDFEQYTARTGTVKGLYGFVEGSCTLSVKFVGSDGFEKITSIKLSDAEIPSLTNVTGIQLDSSTYVF